MKDFSDIIPGIYTIQWQKRCDLALDWVRRSVESTGGKGSSHSWHIWFGWNKAYPETTGYLIPTMLEYGKLLQDESLIDLAKDCGDWLMTEQFENGAFPGLLTGNKTPSVFNTAQILSGFNHLSLKYPQNIKYKETKIKAALWLAEMLEPDGAWRKFAFQKGYTPTYYTRALWPLIEANNELEITGLRPKLHQAISFYEGRIMENLSVRDWGFKPGKEAFTHTLAYTFEGFLECGFLLEKKSLIDRVFLMSDQLLEVRASAGHKTAGRYDQHWKGDYRFICPVGNAQLSAFYLRLYKSSGQEKYLRASWEFLQEILEFQVLKGNKNRLGAIPGSLPVWGAYLPCRYPNWGVKFLLDAMYPFLKLQIARN